MIGSARSTRPTRVMTNGRSEGALIDFDCRYVDAQGTLMTYHLKVFTTRPDTVYGATFMVIAPEYPLVDLVVTEEQWPAVREYRERTARKSELERTDLSRE